MRGGKLRRRSASPRRPTQGFRTCYIRSRDELSGPDFAWPAAPADGGSSNGRTADSDSASLGSNPSPPANLYINEINKLRIRPPFQAAFSMLQRLATNTKGFRQFATASGRSVQHAMQHERSAWLPFRHSGRILRGYPRIPSGAEKRAATYCNI